MCVATFADMVEVSSQGARVDPLRPAWASWIPALDPCDWMYWTIGMNAFVCSSDQMPVG